METEGTQVSHLHLQYIHPFPRNLEAALKGFEKILVPELNMGQLIMLLRNRFLASDFLGYSKVKGATFKVLEIKEKIKELL